jgi:hypothetical protein
LVATARARGFGRGGEARWPAASARSRRRAQRTVEKAHAREILPEVSTKAAVSGAGRRRRRVRVSDEEDGAEPL